MIVVCNTSPLTNLAAIGEFDLLRRLYREIAIAEAVWTELNAKRRIYPGRNEVKNASWVSVISVANRTAVATLREDLDRGESETIVLAIERKADLVLMDEAEGRHKARRLGLEVTGVVGMLLEAKSKGHVSRVLPCLDKLRQEAGFYLRESVYRHALKLANEL
jgi:predicted nucleic acid-binding protein